MSPPMASSLSKQDVLKAELVEGFAIVLSTGKGSDLKITCNGAEFKVHKVILASRSAFFTTACWGAFMEAQSNHIDLPDDDPELVKKMIDYFYLLDYESQDRYLDCECPAPTDLAIDEVEEGDTRDAVVELQEDLPGSGVRECLQALEESYFNYTAAYDLLSIPPKSVPLPQLAIHALTYVIADKYGIQGLKTISMQKLEAALKDSGWILRSQQSFTTKMIKELATAIQTTWTSSPETDNGLRAALLDYVLKNKEVLLGMEDFKLVVQHTPQFACDLLFQALKPKTTKK